MTKDTSTNYFHGEINSEGTDIHLVKDQFLLVYLKKYRGKKVWVRIDRETGQRTIDQNAALHLGLRMLANALNEAGLTMQKVLKPAVEIEWTTETVKKYLFKPIMKAKTGKTSTTELAKTGDIEDIWDTLFRHLGEKFKVEYIEFPNNPNKAR